MSMEPFYAGTQPGTTTISRASFIRSTYMHLAVSIFAFIILSAGLLQTKVGITILTLMGKSQYFWLLILGAFMLVGHIASKVAFNSVSNSAQLTALGVYVIAQAIIFTPLLTLAMFYDPKTIPAAGICTLLLVGGLTFTAFTTKKDFSFLGGIINIGIMVALGLILASVFMGFSLGMVFMATMVVLMGGSILYETSNIIHHYPYDRPAGAALLLFSAIATMFWYILQLFMSRD